MINAHYLCRNFSKKKGKFLYCVVSRNLSEDGKSKSKLLVFVSGTRRREAMFLFLISETMREKYGKGLLAMSEQELGLQSTLPQIDSGIAIPGVAILYVSVASVQTATRFR